MRRPTLRDGELLWREGQQANGMALIVDGQVSVTKALPNARTVEVAQLGSGDAIGEIPLIDSSEYIWTAHVTGSATVLSLRKTDFAALVSRRHPSAFALKRRVAADCGQPTCAAGSPPWLPRWAHRRRQAGGGARADVRRARVLRPAGQQVRAPDDDVPHVRPACALGLSDRRALRRLP